MSKKYGIKFTGAYCTVCQSLKVDGVCSNKSCGYTSSGVKRKGWYVDGAFMDFSTPVTYDEAVKSRHNLDTLFEEEFNEDDGL